MWQSTPWPSPGASSSCETGGAALLEPPEARRYRFIQRFQQQSHRAWEEQSIYRVHPRTRALNAEAYEPRVVAIGPYHHGKEQLEAMEQHKHRALRHFLRRPGTGMRMEEVVGRFREEKTMRRLRGAYAGPLDAQWEDDYMLAALAVLDGCFLLELLLTHGGVMLCDDPGADFCYAKNDPIFGAGRHAVLPYVKADLLGVENQLPLWVLKDLADIATTYTEAVDINSLVRELYGTDYTSPRPDEPLGLHILDVYRKSRLSVGSHTGWTAPFGAQELHHHGVRISASRSSAFTDASYSAEKYRGAVHNFYSHFMEPLIRRRPRMASLRGCLRFFPLPSLLYRVPFARWTAEWVVTSAVLWCLHWLLTCFFILTMFWYIPLWVLRSDLALPCILVDESTEAVLLNLVAFEALHLAGGQGMEVTGYVLLLSSVARAAEDVRVLRRKGVVRCVPEKEDGEVAKMLGRVTRGLLVDGGRMGAAHGEMAVVCSRRPNSWYASWRRYYWKDDEWMKSRVTTVLAVYALLFTAFNLVIAVLGYVLQVRRPVAICSQRN